MRVSYLELRNYRRFRNLKLEFPDGIIGILGLNGAGKSTIIEGMAWALFGNEQETVRTSRDSIRRSGAGSKETVTAILEFEMEGVEYRIEREMGGRNLSMKVVLTTKDGIEADGDKMVKVAVQKLLGMDHRSFFTSVFARQKELNELQEFQPSERKKIVLRMLRIDGIDAAIKLVREDRKAVSQRIDGAQGMLIDSEGHDREAAVVERINSHSESMKLAERDLTEAQKYKDLRTKELSEARQKRDSLDKDYRAYGSVDANLKAARQAIEETRNREAQAVAGIEETERLLKKLPELEKADREWFEVRKRKEALDEDKAKFDRRSILSKDIIAIKKDLSELTRKLEAATREAEETKSIRESIQFVTEKKKEAEETQAALSTRLAGMRARMDERRSKLDEDRDRLAEIERAGKAGACPTCERILDDAYDPLVAKLRASLGEAESAASKDVAGMEAAQSELAAGQKKLDALNRKLSHNDEMLQKATAALATIEALNGEISRAKARVEEKTADVDAIGEVQFSPEEYQKVRELHDKLALKHEELVRLQEKKNQLGSMRRDLEELRKSMEKRKSEERSLASALAELEPKRKGYEDAMKAFDQKTDEAAAAAEMLADARVKKDRIESEIGASRRDLEEIRRLKEQIKSQRDSLEELSLLEDVIGDFKSHLIGRISPTLSEITSEMMSMMTDGKYERIDLDEDYQISIDDDGVLHPLDRFSGGEADIANLSLRLAISRMIAERTGTNQVNLLVLDEIFGSLDPTRKRSVMMALTALASQFRQVMLITHVDDMKDLMAHVVKVEELPDGTSVAKVVS